MPQRSTKAIPSEDPFSDLRVIWAQDRSGKKYIISDHRPEEERKRK